MRQILWARRWTVTAPIAGVAVLAVGAGVWAAFLRPSDAASDGVTYRAATASTGTIRQTVSATGTIAAKDTEELSFSADGEVTAVSVTVGQKVTTGQKLARIDSAALRSAVAAAEATLATAEARLESDESADASSAQLAADEATIAVSRTQLSQARTALAGATLTSPIAGTVTAVNVAVGQQVAGGSSGSGESSDGSQSDGSGGTGGNGSDSSSSSASSSSSSGAAIEVVSTGSYVVNASVDASDIGLIKKNNQVVITPSTSAKNVFGLVSSIGVVATSDSGVASFPVVVSVTGSPSGLYAGATATIEIVYRQLTDVLVVPTLAVTRSGDATTVLVQSGTSRRQRVVTTGASSGGLTQILTGLREGQQVLVPVPTGGQTDGGTGRTGGGYGRLGGGSGGNQGGYEGPPGSGPDGKPLDGEVFVGGKQGP